MTGTVTQKQSDGIEPKRKRKGGKGVAVTVAVKPYVPLLNLFNKSSLVLLGPNLLRYLAVD